MAKKVYAISSINGGMSNDRNFCKPGQVAECVNIDIMSDSNSIRLMGADRPRIINHRGNAGKIIGKCKEYFIAEDGKYDHDAFYSEDALTKNLQPRGINYALLALPSQITKVQGGDKGDWRENRGSGETTIINTINIIHKSEYFDLEYQVLATRSFLHLVKNPVLRNTIAGNVSQGEWSGTGWTRTGNGYQHEQNTNTPLVRDFTSILSSFQWQFACKNWTQGSVTLSIEYTGEEHIKDGNLWQTKERKKVFTKTYKVERNGLINAVAIEGRKSGNLRVSFVPTSDFDGELWYNGLYEIGDLQTNPTDFEELYGIRVNYHKIPPASSHPMVILGNKLYVGGENKIAVFTIEPYEGRGSNKGNIQLVEQESIHLGAGMKIVGLSQYGDKIMIYANSIKDAYQLISDGYSEGVENTIIWRGVQFQQVGNDGSQDFMVTISQGGYRMYVVSGGNKQLLYSSKKMPDSTELISNDEELFCFDGGASFANMERFGIARRTGEVYLLESSQQGKILSRYQCGEDKHITHLYEATQNRLAYCYTQEGKNYVQHLQFDGEGVTLQDGYITLPTLSTHYQEGQLESVKFGAYLPNKQGKIEIWCAINEKDYVTFWIKNIEGKEFSNVKIRTRQGEVPMELIDENLEEGYVSFRLVGVGNGGSLSGIEAIVNEEGEVLVSKQDIHSYDHSIKIEEITRENQQLGSKEIGWNTEIKIQKINHKIGTFGKLRLTLKMRAGGSLESPRIYAPILLTYSVKDE